jgi:hypothetical protein
LARLQSQGLTSLVTCDAARLHSGLRVSGLLKKVRHAGTIAAMEGMPAGTGLSHGDGYDRRLDAGAASCDGKSWGAGGFVAGGFAECTVRVR